MYTSIFIITQNNFSLKCRMLYNRPCFGMIRLCSHSLEPDSYYKPPFTNSNLLDLNLTMHEWITRINYDMVSNQALMFYLTEIFTV